MYWQTMLLTSIRLLGNAHANAVVARDRLALAYEEAGRSGDAVAVFASALADRERTLGTAHPQTIAARGQLAHAYVSAGRTAEAVGLYAQMVSDATGSWAWAIRSPSPPGAAWPGQTRRQAGSPTR